MQTEGSRCRGTGQVACGKPSPRCVDVRGRRDSPGWLGVYRCVDGEWTAENSAAGGLFSTNKTTCSCEQSHRRGLAEQDTCENARRNPGRERVLIKNSARENRRCRPFRWLAAALRRSYSAERLPASFNGVKRGGIVSKRRVRSVSKAAKTQREGEERGAEKTPCSPVAAASTFKLCRRVGKCIFRRRGGEDSGRTLPTLAQRRAAS